MFSFILDFAASIYTVIRCRLHRIFCGLVLYYGLFFADRIAIFKMNSNEILSCFGYSDKQHKGNEGEGQFHLNRSSIDYHMQNHFVQWLTYEELFELLNAL